MVRRGGINGGLEVNKWEKKLRKMDLNNGCEIDDKGGKCYNGEIEWWMNVELMINWEWEKELKS